MSEKEAGEAGAKGSKREAAKAAVARAAGRISSALARRAQARGPSGFDLVIADRIGLMDPARWDGIVSESSLFFSRPYLEALEKSGPKNIAPRYAMLFKDGKAQGAMAMQIAAWDLSGLGESGGLAAKGALFAGKGLLDRALVCGNLLSYGEHGVAAAPGVEPESLWPAVAEALYRVRRAEKLSGQADVAMVKDVLCQTRRGAEALRALSYRPLETEPNMALAIDPEWGSHEAYLGSMTSKYRSSVKQQILKPMEQAGWRVERVQSVQAVEGRLMELYLQTHQGAAFRPFTLPMGYFSALQGALGENFVCSALVKEGAMCGFVITLKDRETAMGYHIGFDRELSEPVYLRLLHASVADAIGLGCSRLSLGRTALEPKARLGAKPEPMEVWMRHRQPAMNAALKSALAFIPHEEAPERDPFKKRPGQSGGES